MIQLHTFWSLCQRVPKKDTSSIKLHHSEECIPRHKGHSCLCQGNPKEDELWQQCITMLKLSSIQVNREDNEYFK